MKKFITIIGSREINDEEEAILMKYAKNYHDKGYTLRSGGAYGADCVVNKFENVEIIIPWNGFNGFQHDGKRIFALDQLPDQAIAIATVEKIHPAPERLSQGALKLHSRNIYQITGVLGVNREQLSTLVIFCADEYKNKVRGGTATAVNLARKLKVPTINIR